MLYLQVNTLERDASRVLSLVRSVKNTFAPVNRIPPDVISLIPNHWEDGDRDENLVRLTHVCRGWRELLISRPLLWTNLNCTDTEKTKTYIERSKSCPLEIRVGKVNDAAFNWEEAFLLTIPHIGRLGTLSVSGSPANVLPVLTEHFSCPVPLLSNLKIVLTCDQPVALPDRLFDGDLSSLRELGLAGVITSLPWRGLSNLTTLTLCHIPEDKILLTQLLDFFESAPRLHHVQFHDSIPNSRDAPAERLVSLPHLKELNIVAQPPHSILLDHLSIPIGTSLCLGFTFGGMETPIRSYLPRSLYNLRNLSHITAAHLHFGLEPRYLELNGPSGELYMFCIRALGGNQLNTVTIQNLLSLLTQFDVSKNRWLAITLCNSQPVASLRVEAWGFYQTLRSMEDLRTLTLAECNNLPFIRILDPSDHCSKGVLCPKLEELNLYIKRPDQFHVEELLRMAGARAARGAKLSSMLIVSLIDAFITTKEVLKLRKHVSCVEYKLGDALPEWDTLPAV